MHSDDIEDRINKYWAAQFRFVSDVERGMFERTAVEDGIEEYVSPSVDMSVAAKWFVCWLDVGFMDCLLREVFTRYEVVEERLVPRVRFLAYFCLGRKNFLKAAYRSLEPEDFFNMGFASVPNYELLRVFVYERIGRERLKTVFDIIIQEVGRLLAEQGIKFGNRVGEDATDVPSLKHDKEAEYSGYYKEYGYKVDIVHDLDQETLPLDYTLLNINDDEGKCLPPTLKRLESKEIKTEELKVDGKYATYHNIAFSETQQTRLIYKVQESWVPNEKGTIHEIKRRYQRYHHEPDFKATNDIAYMLSYLHKKGDYEHVGAYYRNQAMEQYQQNPTEYLQRCNERSGKTEGIMATIKTETILGTRPTKRGWKAFAFTTNISMLAFAFAALIKTQNHDTQRLGNLTYIT